MNAIKGAISASLFPAHLVKDGMHGIINNPRVVLNQPLRPLSEKLIGGARDTFSHLEHVNPDSKLASQAENMFIKGFNIIKKR